MEKFLLMESGYKRVHPKMRKVKWSIGYWIYGQVENCTKLAISDYVENVAMWKKWPKK
jgi:hypothetical protein